MSWFWVIVIAFFVIRAIMAMSKKSSAQDNEPQAGQQPRVEHGSPTGSSSGSTSGSTRPFSGSASDLASTGQPNAAWAPAARQPGQQNPGWAPAAPPAPPPAPTAAGWRDRLAAEMEAQISSLAQYGEPPADLAPPRGAPTVDQLPSPTPPAALIPAVAAAVAAEPAPSPSPPLTSFAHDRSDIGSAALESTLDSTIESSLFGSSPGPITVSVLPGAATERLPREIEAAVAAFMEAGQEVGAVRFLCDERGMGILDALRAAHEVAGHPIS